jgi:hypothetical protein
VKRPKLTANVLLTQEGDFDEKDPEVLAILDSFVEHEED